MPRKLFLRKTLALLSLVTLLTHPAMGFDAYWHSVCIQKAGQQLSFTEDASKIMQLGNFSPDFFGPVADYASGHLNKNQIDALNQYQASNAQVRQAAVFLHFDNLNSDFQRNSDFDFVFTHLLANTQRVLAGYSKLRIDDRVRKTLVLVTLGASLHCVEDFYSHSDWVHNDFDKTDVKTVKLPDGSLRAPTWFEFRAKHADPNAWPFHVQSGIFPPIAGAPNTHTHMNHDNSRLLYAEPENGQPLRSQAEHHNSGPVAAHGDDASDLAHQQFAVNTATAATIEWIQKVEENTDAKQAIESAKTWKLKSHDPHLAKELEAGIITETALSCAAGKWDGDNPPGERGTLCRAVLERQVNSAGNATGSQVKNEIIGLAASLLMPAALKYTGTFWDVHSQYHVLEGLVQDIGSQGGHYGFGKK